MSFSINEKRIVRVPWLIKSLGPVAVPTGYFLSAIIIMVGDSSGVAAPLIDHMACAHSMDLIALYRARVYTASYESERERENERMRER